MKFLTQCAGIVDEIGAGSSIIRQSSARLARFDFVKTRLR
jgi:hypothetical protein